MPNFKTGNMWDAWDTADLFLITTNAVIKMNGELVMGRGLAKEAVNRDPQISLYFGRTLADVQQTEGRIGYKDNEYGFIIPNLWPHRKEGMFQTKGSWKEFANIHFIQLSTTMLLTWCLAFPDQEVHLNYPGIGNSDGELDKTIVEPVIAALPENVTIWSKE